MAQYTNTASTGGFIGIVFDAGETFTSLDWAPLPSVSSGIDDVEAYTVLVPEPSTLVLVALGLASLRLHRRRARR